MTVPPIPSGRPHGTGTLFMLALVSALGSVAIHMMVPALPLVAADLAIDQATAQQIISFYLFGLAAGQLVVGPAIDRIGRAPVLLGGTALFVLAAGIGAVTGSITTLLLARVAQALGASAGLVTARVLVGDLFDRDEAARRQATLMSVMLISPAIAPVIGGLATEAAGWRATLALPAALGFVALLSSRRFLAIKPPRRPAAGKRHSLRRDYATLLRNRTFVRAACTIAASSSALYMFLSASPFLLISQWGLDAGEAGYCLLACAVAGIAGAQSTGWVERRTNGLRAGVAITSSGALLALGLALAGIEGWPALIGPVSMMMFGTGLTAPAALAVVIHSEEGLAGTAASLAGALQMIVSAVASSLLMMAARPSFLLLGCGMAAASLTAFLCIPRRVQAS